ncbi:MAG: uL15 family ribosomal protein [Candidatus Yanofskybacteria bacterium]|nr:uL15 family ribosomal protein [Candidatus Yanofskybacteria bacterium]
MDLSKLQSKTPRKPYRRVGRGGKRGTYSGKGSKGQKSRAGAGFKPGFRGGDNRIWQLFPKQRGASKKPGSNRPHVKHRYYRIRGDKFAVFNLDFFNRFDEGQIVNPKLLAEQGWISKLEKHVKVLGDGELKKRIDFQGLKFSRSAESKIAKTGGKIL